MKGRIRLISAGVATAAVLLLAAPASATHVQCGDTITTTTTLDSDVVCPDGAQYGLLIGADDVILKLKNFTIQGGSGSLTGILNGSSDQDGLQNIEIKRGTVEGFLTGIDLNPIDDSAVVKVNVTTTDTAPFGGDLGIALEGDRNTLDSNTVTATGDGAEVIRLSGDDVYAWGNIVTPTGTGSGRYGISATGERPRVVYNQVTNCGPSGFGGTGILVQGYSEYAVVNRNTVAGCDVGVSAQLPTDAGGGARVALNNTTGGTIGIRVGDTSASVNRNTTREASDTGILIDTPGTTVRRNGAFDNGNYGIFGPVGTVDGGENIASGNGDGTNPQCVNVTCSSPPPT